MVTKFGTVSFEHENKTRTALVLRTTEELASRESTISEFFLAYVYANTRSITAALHYLDYLRAKKDEKARQRAQAASEDSMDSDASEDPF
jgi:hypothetical protein